MSSNSTITADEMRTRFSALMSDMYRKEVPAYGDLLDLVSEINQEYLSQRPDVKATLIQTSELDRISSERHGAIRLGKPSELSTIKRIFSVMGMHPVGYYDLSPAGGPRALNCI